MPPRVVFRSKHRPSGMEYPSCYPCNHGTRAADAAVGFFARIDRFGDDPTSWKVQEARKPLKSLGTLAPGFYNEFFADDAAEQVLVRTPNGILVPVAKMQSGPISQALLTVFAAKLGMALYREHTSEPLPLDDAVFTMWFLNAGLNQKTADAMLGILPAHSTLRQGRGKDASGQFDYRYNSDDKTIVGALSHFHGNIHFFTLAMAEPEKFALPDEGQFTKLVRPGQLLQLMPKPAPLILMPRQRVQLKSDWLLVPKNT